MKRLSNKELQFLNKCLKENERVEVFKFIHEITGYTFEKSKEIIDCFFLDASFLNNFKYKVSGEQTKNNEKSSNTLNNNEKKYIHLLLKNGKKIEALNFVYEKFGIRLKEAKEYVDNFSYQ